MTTDHTTPTEARRARLEACEADDTITVPDDWQLPDDVQAGPPADLRPGDGFTNDGTGNFEWSLDRPARNRPRNLIWYRSATLAALGLEPDKVVARWNALGDVPVGHVAYLDEPTTFPPNTYSLGIGPGITIAKAKRLGSGWELTDADGCTFRAREEQVDALGFTPDMFRTPATRTVTAEELDATPEADGPADDADTTTRGAKARAARDREESTSIGHVHVTITPDTDAFEARLDELSARADELAARIATLPETYVLDEYQRERVAALEQALRILESRRAAKGAEPGSLASMFGKRAEVPMVGKRDLVDVAAFIADGDTGRTEVSA